jgi:hypothetical protein
VENAKVAPKGPRRAQTVTLGCSRSSARTSSSESLNWFSRSQASGSCGRSRAEMALLSATLLPTLCALSTQPPPQLGCVVQYLPMSGSLMPTRRWQSHKVCYVSLESTRSYRISKWHCRMTPSPSIDA